MIRCSVCLRKLKPVYYVSIGLKFFGFDKEVDGWAYCPKCRVMSRIDQDAVKPMK